MVLRVLVILGFLFSATLKSQINPASNYIGLDISTQPESADFNYDSCFALGVNMGMSRVGVFQNWTAIETAPDTFDMSVMDIANIYYPAHHMSVDLTLAPIHTNNLEVPSDLTSKTFDHPDLMNRFKSLLDTIKVHIPDVTLSSLVIGSEHDVYMGDNVLLWQQYKVFYDSVATYAKKLWPGIKVATELTFNGITAYNTFAQELNENSDYIGISYYPLNSDFTVKPVSTVPVDFKTLVDLYPEKPICFYQYGYPSSSVCNSSETLQAHFISQTFSSWDTYAENIQMIDFTWLHDLDTAYVNYYGSYYGITDTVFLEYLRTIGLRTSTGNGSDKAGLGMLRCQAKQRGYNNLKINCSAGIENSTLENYILTVNLNPAHSIISIDIPFELKNGELSIYNPLGQIEKRLSVIKNKHIVIPVADLPNGLYILVLQDGNKQARAKLTLSK